MEEWGMEWSGKGSLTVLLVGTFGGTPELPCPGTVVPGWHCTWRPPDICGCKTNRAQYTTWLHG